MKEVDNQLRYNIRKIRELRGYSQEYMATELEVSTKTYSRIECGQGQLTVPRLNKIAKILNVAAEDIMHFTIERLVAGVGQG